MVSVAFNQFRDPIVGGWQSELHEHVIEDAASLSSFKQSPHIRKAGFTGNRVLSFQLFGDAPEPAGDKVALQVKRIVKVEYETLEFHGVQATFNLRTNNSPCSVVAPFDLFGDLVPWSF
jgi:hypothetical protein